METGASGPSTMSAARTVEVVNNTDRVLVATQPHNMVDSSVYWAMVRVIEQRLNEYHSCVTNKLVQVSDFLVLGDSKIFNFFLYSHLRGPQFL